MPMMDDLRPAHPSPHTACRGVNWRGFGPAPFETENVMTTIFEGTGVYRGISGDLARVTSIDGRVLIRAADTMAEEGATIAMTPEQARKFSTAIMVAANDAEADAT